MEDVIKEYIKKKAQDKTWEEVTRVGVEAAASGGGRWRPECHFTPPYGWMNDPNGLCFFKGWYHLFYQYNPYGCEWDTMHWGHAVSRDMLHWEDLGIALYPDRSYDNGPRGGCFSGSAFVENETLYLFYTGVAGEKQTQNVACSKDGLHFEKYAGNPVIGCPPEGTSADFRDPKVLKENGGYYMVVGGCTGSAQEDGDGRIYLYESKDLFHWSYKGNVMESKGRCGTMFECPDLFPLGDRWVLTSSPINHPRGNKAMYFVGRMDFERCEYTVESVGNMDVGQDFYAPQSFAAPDGRRVLTGWMNGWQWMPWYTGFGGASAEGFQGIFSFPRSPYLKEGKLCFLPVAEVRTLEGEEQSFKQLTVTEKGVKLGSAGGGAFKAELRGRVEKAKSLCLTLELRGTKDGEAYFTVELDWIAGVLTLDTKGHGRVRGRFDLNLAQYHLDLYADHSAVEIFLNGGELCLSNRCLPVEEDAQVWLRTPYRTAQVEEAGLKKLAGVFGAAR